MRARPDAPVRPDPLVSVIIPAFGRPTSLRAALQSVIDQDLDPETFEVIVADSSPDDQNVRLVRELQASTSCALTVVTKEPEGPGPSRNLGAATARGSILAFTDSDCVASPGWLRAGLAAFGAGAGIVQGRTIPDPASERTALSVFVWVERESFIYETANVFYRREAFVQAGGFQADRHANKDRPVGGEDVDLAWKVKRRGWESRFARDALVIHEVVPLTPWRWLYEKRLQIFPRLVRDYPELRRFFFARYFYNKAHAWLAVAVVGLTLTGISPWALIAGGPYVAIRLLEHTETFRGWRRPLRVAAHLARDTISLAVLLVGSVRHRSVLL